MNPEEKLEVKKIESIAKGLLSNFDKANLSKSHQKKIVQQMSNILNL